MNGWIRLNRAAFFHGQVEQPNRGFLGMVSYSDARVLVAINERGVYIIDPFECVSINNY